MEAVTEEAMRTTLKVVAIGPTNSSYFRFKAIVIIKRAKKHVFALDILLFCIKNVIK